MNKVSKHYSENRYSREKFIKEHIGEDEGYIVDGFVVNKGHKNGSEIHSITSKGIIIVSNLLTDKLVTKLIARPGQIERYYTNTGRKHPEEYDEIIRLAKEHLALKYNRR